MMIKMNSKESLEIVENVFVHIINEHGTLYLSWDDMSEQQKSQYHQLKCEFQGVYEKFKQGKG